MSTPIGSGHAGPNSDVSAIVSEAGQLINLAYRLVGSMADAEDVLQEAYTRWYGMPLQRREAIESPAAWLTTVVSRICLDLLGSARVRRERYVGEWLPEPVPEHTEWTSSGTSATPVNPADRVTLDESVNMAFLVVLETMTAAERVSFILHDVFRYSFTEVAEIVGRTPAACRQLASSARRRIGASHTPATPTTHQARVVSEFRKAWDSKDIDALVGLLDPEATAIADGGGRAVASPFPIDGAEQIARFYLHIAEQAPADITLVERTVNGQPGLVMQQSGVALTVFAFDLVGGRIKHIWAMRNPDKLRYWTTN
jgi:RNA polymerase sigma factor (sigma-70 family)